MLSFLNIPPTQIGENGSCEYAWSTNIKEKILQLSFQLTRTHDFSQIEFLASKTNEIICELNNYFQSSLFTRDEYLYYMTILYCMIGHTRDIVDGKGEYSLAFMLLNVWNSYFPELAKYAFKLFVSSPENIHPFGSWKDIKNFYKQYDTSSLAEYGCELLLEQLRIDSTSENPSLAAKWVPREKSQFSELFSKLATTYFRNYIESAKTEDSKKKAVIKAKTHFRKLISSLNKKLDTVQIKQCGLNWSAIVPSNQTSITMHKQKRAFLNVNKDGSVRYSNNDRIVCAETFTKFIEQAKKGEIQIKGKRVGLNDFTKDALLLIDRKQQTSPMASLLNAQWTDNSTQNGALGKMIAMVDVSLSMTDENSAPLNTAIALGIRIAEKSMLGKRILTFSSQPCWLNLEEHNDFVSMVEEINKTCSGMNTNFDAALKLILDAIISQKLKPEDVEDMVLTILSDMQIDCADTKYKTLVWSINSQYADAGMRLWGKPFKPPHILFWNLRSTKGFPALSTNKNTSMMSGFSPAILNLFCDEGISALKNYTAWDFFVKSLDNERYKPLSEFIKNVL